MKTSTFRTNLRCEGCVNGIRPLLDSEPRIQSWSADVADPRKLLRIVSENYEQEDLATLLAQAGYTVLGEEATQEHLEQDTESKIIASAEPSPETTYKPVWLLVVLVLAATCMVELAAGTWDSMRAMRHFMGGYFLAFAYFKLLNVRSFASSYQMYDLLARRWQPYGVIYPYLELALGLAYLAGYAPILVNSFTLFLMTFSTAGVLLSLFHGNKVKCACLGAVFNLPMSYVTLVEDLGMALMAGVMLLLYFNGWH